jgi:menaquinone-dependent protoporphyrinogen oxidase
VIRTLIAYSTTDGHTVKICHKIKHVLERRGHVVTLSDIGKTDQLELPNFDKIVIGASIRYGRHSPLVYEFIENHLSFLAAIPSAFFSVNIVARKPEKSSAATNPYLQRFLKQISWCPSQVAVFAGKLDYPSYRASDRLMIRLIMLLTGGPTAADTVVEFTNWQAVETFGESLA